MRKEYTPQWIQTTLVKTVTSLGGFTYHICKKQKSILEMSRELAVVDERGNYFMDVTKETLNMFIEQDIWKEKI